MKATELIKKLWYCTNPNVKIKEFGKIKKEMIMHSSNIDDYKKIMEFCEQNKYSVASFIIGNNELTINVISKQRK